MYAHRRYAAIHAASAHAWDAPARVHMTKRAAAPQVPGSQNSAAWETAAPETEADQKTLRPGPSCARGERPGNRCRKPATDFRSRAKTESNPSTAHSTEARANHPGGGCARILAALVYA